MEKVSNYKTDFSASISENTGKNLMGSIKNNRKVVNSSIPAKKVKASSYENYTPRDKMAATKPQKKPGSTLPKFLKSSDSNKMLGKK